VNAAKDITSRDILRGVSRRGWIISGLLLIWFYAGLPLLSGLFFEAYHLTKIDGVYSVYGVVKFLTGHMAIWPYRWLATLILALCFFGILYGRSRRRLKRRPLGKGQAL